METSSLKRACSHRFIDQYTGKCLHCGYHPSPLSFEKPRIEFTHDHDEVLEVEHYERLVQMLDQWKNNMIKRIESIHKSQFERLRDEFECQQMQRRQQLHKNQNQVQINNEQQTKLDLTANNFRLSYSSDIDTEYTLLAASPQSIFVHDGRAFKLFDKNLRPLIALDLTQSMRERFKVVDLCYVTYLSAYLILYEHGLWIFEPGSNANLVSSMRRRGYLSLTANSKDLFVLDKEGTIEQRSLTSWTYLRRYSRQHLLNDQLNDHLISIRFHLTDSTKLMAVVRTTNNRRSVMIYQHYGSNTFKLLNRVLFPNVNIYSVAPLHISNIWLMTTCEKKVFLFLDHTQQDHQREQQQIYFALDCDCRIKNAVSFQSNPRSLVIRTIRPNQIKLYHF